MTGFAALTSETAQATVTVTIRALNHRHLDLQLRLPQSAASLEADVRGLVAKSIARGRVEVGVSVQQRVTPEVEVEFNEDFGRALESALHKARARGLVTGTLTPGDLLRLPQAITIREKPTNDDGAAQEALTGQVMDAVGRAVAGLDRMRAREGEHLRQDLDARRALVADLVERIAVAAEEGRAALEQRLADRVRELRASLAVPMPDDSAIAQEIVRTAGRSDISEEIARFRAHVSHWVTLADSPEPCGRKLDFLLQEMNREVNTMGSKADGLRVSDLVIAAKAELEKMREQVQNVE